MIHLNMGQVIRLQAMLIDESGGDHGILDRGKIDSALALQRASYDGQDLYPTLVDKAAAVGYSLACNHGFVDGNKRIGHAALETLLVLNGYELNAGVDEQEAMFLQLASGAVRRDAFTEWVRQHVVPLPTGDGT